MYIGTNLYGFCDGYFGRDDYDNKRIEGIGSDWIVARYIDGMDEDEVVFANFDSTEEMEGYIKQWSIKPWW